MQPATPTLRQPFSWGRFDPAFLDDLASRLSGLRVLETFAGNGLLAAGLAARGIDVLATSILSGEDRHDEGMYHHVLRLDATEAVLGPGRDRDALLMSWPPANGSAARCAAAWGEGRPLAFVGEATDPERGWLGGCGTDDLFAMMADVEPVMTYAGRNWLDVAFTATVRIPSHDAPWPVDWRRFRAGERRAPFPYRIYRTSTSN